MNYILVFCECGLVKKVIWKGEKGNLSNIYFFCFDGVGDLLGGSVNNLLSGVVNLLGSVGVVSGGSEGDLFRISYFFELVKELVNELKIIGVFVYVFVLVCFVW